MVQLAVLAVALATAYGPPAAPASGDNVVVLRVASVSIPHELPGECTVRAKVEEVRSGGAFRPGQGLVIQVPCTRHVPGRLPPPLRRPPRPLLDAEVLSLHERAAARIDDAGRLIWRRSARPYGRLGYVSGYRVLDAVYLPAKPTRPR